MKTTCYLRIARNRRQRWKFTFAVSLRQPETPITDQYGVLRTACVKLNLDLPDSLFGPAAEVDVFVDPTQVSPIVEAGR